VLKGARISHFGLGISIECKVRNLSEDGACVIVASLVGVPETFDLVFRDGIVRHCKFEWRTAEKIGVSFARSFQADGSRGVEALRRTGQLIDRALPPQSGNR
jgi:hypothetical protein